MLVCRLTLVAATALPIAGCSGHVTPAPVPVPVPQPTASPPVRDSAAPLAARETVRDTVLERRSARLEMRLLEKEAQISELESRLEEARGEVVRALARMQSVANRAEAASGIAEAEIALQSLNAVSRSPRAPEVAQIAALVHRSSVEFDKQNYGGALYLVGQAKTLAAASRGRLAIGARASTRPGEVPFALSIPLRVASRGNVRSGPGPQFAILFAIESGTSLTGYSYVDDWLRVSDGNGRSGWINRSLVTTAKRE